MRSAIKAHSNTAGAISLIVIAGVLLLMIRANNMEGPYRLLSGGQPDFAREIVQHGRYSTNTIQFRATSGENCEFSAPDYAVVRAAIFHGKTISVRCVLRSITPRWVAIEITVDGVEVLTMSEATAYVRREDLEGYIAIAFCLSLAGLFFVRRPKATTPS